jgi:chromate transporter
VTIRVSRVSGLAALAIFSILLAGVLLVPAHSSQNAFDLFAAFYRSGALVFGGGHVVLPLPREAFVTPGWVSDDAFLAGYGAAQAVPGPLFTFAAYLGAVVKLEPNGLAGAALGLISIFLPGMLVLVGMLPFWGTVRTRPRRAGCDARG